MIGTLQEYLKRYNWDFVNIEANIILTGFSDENDFSYPITVSVREDIITMVCAFQANASTLAENIEKLLLLLRFNFSWPLAKIGLDDEGAIMLAVDLPSYGLSYEAFAIGLDILSETVQMLTAELPELKVISEEQV